MSEVFPFDHGSPGHVLNVDASGRIVTTFYPYNNFYVYGYGDTGRYCVVDASGRLGINPDALMENIRINNLGTGSGIYRDRINTIWNFRTLRAGPNIAITGDNEELTITAGTSGVALDLQLAYNEGNSIDLAVNKPLTLTQGANSHALDVTKTATGSGYAVKIKNHGNSSALWVENMNQGGVAGYFSQGPTTNTVVYINCSGTGNGITLNKIGNQNNGIRVNTTANGANGILSYTTGDSNGLYVHNVNDNDCIVVYHQGSASGYGVYISSNSPDPSLKFANTGSSVKDVDGTGSTWSVTKTGGAVFRGLTLDPNGPRTYEIDGILDANPGHITVSSVDSWVKVKSGLSPLGDVLVGILGGTYGQILTLQAEDASETITVSNGTDIKIGSNFDMDSLFDRVVLQNIGSNTWVCLSKQSNA